MADDLSKRGAQDRSWSAWARSTRSGIGQSVRGLSWAIAARHRRGRQFSGRGAKRACKV